MQLMLYKNNDWDAQMHLMRQFEALIGEKSRLHRQGRLHLPLVFEGAAQAVAQQVVELPQNGAQRLQAPDGQSAAPTLLEDEKYVVHHRCRQRVCAPLVYRDRFLHILFQVELFLQYNNVTFSF